MTEVAAVEWLESERFGVIRRGRADWCFDPEDTPDALAQVRCVHPSAFGGEAIQVTVISLDGLVCVISLQAPKKIIPSKHEDGDSAFGDGEAIYAALLEEYGEPIPNMSDSETIWWRTNHGDELNLWVMPGSGPHMYRALNFFDTERWSLAIELAQCVRSSNLLARSARYGLVRNRSK